MILQQVGSDSLKAAVDTIAAQKSLLNEITFAPEKVIEGDGLMITIVGYVIVFSALLFLYMFIRAMTRALLKQQKKRVSGSGEEASADYELHISGEVNAAIALALHLHFAEMHDIESTKLTIKKVQRTYSPWSSKIYGLREYPK